jgi:hypothetical protein
MRRRAEQEYLSYRRLREDLQANPDDAPGLSTEL